MMPIYLISQRDKSKIKVYTETIPLPLFVTCRVERVLKDNIYQGSLSTVDMLILPLKECRLIENCEHYYVTLQLKCL